MTNTDHGFSATRRLILQGAGAVALVGLGSCFGNLPFGLAPAFAAANDKYPEEAFKAKSDVDAIKALYGKTAEASDKVKMDAPEIAENGAVVPVSVSVDSPMTPTNYVKHIYVVADKNRMPVVTRVTLAPEAGRAFMAGKPTTALIARRKAGCSSTGDRAARILRAGRGMVMTARLARTE